MECSFVFQWFVYEISCVFCSVKGCSSIPKTSNKTDLVSAQRYQRSSNRLQQICNRLHRNCNRLHINCNRLHGNCKRLHAVLPTSYPSITQGTVFYDINFITCFNGAFNWH